MTRQTVSLDSRHKYRVSYFTDPSIVSKWNFDWSKIYPTFIRRIVMPTGIIEATTVSSTLKIRDTSLIITATTMHRRTRIYLNHKLKRSVNANALYLAFTVFLIGHASIHWATVTVSLCCCPQCNWTVEFSAICVPLYVHVCVT